MKNFLKFKNIIYSIILTILVNSYLFVKEYLYLLIVFIAIFIVINIIIGLFNIKTKFKRLKTCNHGVMLLTSFYCSLIPSIIYHGFLAIYLIPDNYIDFIISTIVCICASAIIFWNGIICVYLTSYQMGFKWRIIGLLCGLIPIVNLIVLYKIINLVHDEIEFELEKEQLDNTQKEMCKTKFPILLVHGVFFRDFKKFNYWGRIPRTLESRGAKIYYGEHQSALSIQKSAKELAARIKYIVERTGCEKVNIIAHSKGGLDCRYALSEYNIDQYVASLTTVNTPHRGCVFADRLLDAAPESLKNSVSKIYNTALKELGDEEPNFMEAVTDLTNSSCKILNEKLHFPENVYLQSIGSVITKPQSGKFPLNLSYRYVKDFDGENDGLVGIDSFQYGDNYTLLRINEKRGISHVDIIDLNRENIKGFDVREFYCDLVKDLKDRGY